MLGYVNLFARKSFVELAHNDVASDFLTQVLPLSRRKFVQELVARRAFESVHWYQEAFQRRRIGNFVVGHHESANGHLRAAGVLDGLLGHNELEEMSRHRNARRVANDFICNPELAVDGIALGQVERTSDNADVDVVLGEPAAEIFKMSPVVTVETVTDLGCHVGQEERLVHRIL